jgi:hypothetical protein
MSDKKITNRPFKIVQLHAHYREGHTTCSVLVNNDGNHKCYEINIDGFDISDNTVQEKLIAATELHKISKIEIPDPITS